MVWERNFNYHWRAFQFPVSLPKSLAGWQSATKTCYKFPWMNNCNIAPEFLWINNCLIVIFITTVYFEMNFQPNIGTCMNAVLLNVCVPVCNLCEMNPYELILLLCLFWGWVNSCKASPKVGCSSWSKCPTLAWRGRKLTVFKINWDDPKSLKRLEKLTFAVKNLYLDLKFVCRTMKQRDLSKLNCNAKTKLKIMVCFCFLV